MGVASVGSFLHPTRENITPQIITAAMTRHTILSVFFMNQLSFLSKVRIVSANADAILNIIA